MYSAVTVLPLVRREMDVCRCGLFMDTPASKIGAIQGMNLK
ncbi:hypothetical protein D779_0638 [Imhoffiella purpurea]|uniref:Uncharacterized protein n=1 Tax=Imhoffiella purpurea TaxID=1249627 RepID=W9V994_9GAMM|nr:hypothetical protein D779_0638 [Imhoffiella purpurea]